MTKCYVNGKEAELPPGIFSLSEALNYVEAAFLPPQSAIRQIRLDNRQWPADQAEMADTGPVWGTDISAVRELDITTENLKDSARICVAEILAELERIKGITNSLIKRYSPFEFPAALENLRHLREGLIWTSLLLTRLASDFQINDEKGQIPGAGPAEIELRSTPVLQRFSDLLKNRDLAQLADLIRDEINPMISAWIELLEMIRHRLPGLSLASQKCVS